MSIKIALAGNPNCGKTTLFNNLTGSNQYVGNWPGVTVEKKEGKLKGDKDVVIQDLPGIYSLSPYTLEEVVSRTYLVKEKPDAILNIIDGTNIERNLYLTTQLIELGIPVVMAVNMIDLVRKNGDKIDLKKLSAELGCQAVEISALKGEGTEAAAKAAAAENAAKAATTVEVKELSFDELLATKVPEIKVVDMGVKYKGYNPESQTFVTIGERIHCIAPSVRKAMDERDPEPILKRAAEQIAAGATYLDVNIGPAEKDGPERMMWAVKLLQENFNNVPLALDTANKRAIEAGIKVYNRTNGKPIVNSADAGSRISNIDLAAANDAICIALCSADGIAKDNEERMKHCHNMLERGMSLGMDATDLWFDPLFLVVKGMQDKQMDVLNAIKLFADEGLKSTGGLSNNSNGAPKNVRPIMDSALVAMAMMQGLTSAIVNPNDLRLMETIKSCDIFKNNELYSDSYLDA